MRQIGDFTAPAPRPVRPFSDMTSACRKMKKMYWSYRSGMRRFRMPDTHHTDTRRDLRDSPPSFRLPSCSAPFRRLRHSPKPATTTWHRTGSLSEATRITNRYGMQQGQDQHQALDETEALPFTQDPDATRG